jgi:hypothetical protein
MLTSDQRTARNSLDRPPAKAAALVSAQSRESKLPDGCTWGVQVQVCPGCKKVGGLVDECNHIVCESCYTNFCFLCGKEAARLSSHWNLGNECPRYGVKGSARAIFDEPRRTNRLAEKFEAEERAALLSSLRN